MTRKLGGCGVTALDGTDDVVLRPEVFIATTSKTYEVPFFSPVTVHDVDVGDAVQPVQLLFGTDAS